MGQLEKSIEKLYRKPIPNDMRIDEIVRIVKAYGCITETGGKHPLKIVYPPTNTVIPIPMHGSLVGEAYIKQIKLLLDEITASKNK